MARSIVNILDLSVDEIYHLLDLADDIDQHPEKYQDRCAHKQLATLFFEPSTRTRLSFESAMLALGGQTLGFAGASNSSASKGESVADTIEVLSNYVDIIAMRHPKEGAPVVAAMHTSVPLVNAGDGGHFHPTQTLADLLTIRRTKGTIEGLTIGFCGDLKFGRTVHSLIDAMLRYPNNRYILISPEELRLPEYEIDKLKEAGAEFVETRSLEEAMPELDILYMTRVQKERFFNEEDYLRLKDIYILTPEKLKTAKADMAILHPLPRVNEISVAVDQDPRAKYFYQTRCGKQMRMALILYLLGLDK
ncbi:MAG: aspartate carbamoyltransferase [Oribacterium sp.]|nr:aspartate carbamoyltransferase [Oribacterium sp.]